MEKFANQIQEANTILESGGTIRLTESYKPTGRQTILSIKDGELVYCPVVDGKRRVIEFSRDELHNSTTGLSIVVAFSGTITQMDRRPSYLQT